MPKVVDPELRRAELAQAASRVIARSGIDGASLREVAAEAGWTTGALSHYFTNKRALLAFTLEASLDRVRAERAARAETSATDELCALFRSILPTTREMELHWVVTLAFAAHAHADPELGVVQRDAYRHFRRSVIDLLERGALGASAAGADLEVEAERLISLADGIAVQALFDTEHWTTERQLAALDRSLACAPAVAAAIEVTR